LYYYIKPLVSNGDKYRIEKWQEQYLANNNKNKRSTRTETTPSLLIPSTNTSSLSRGSTISREAKEVSFEAKPKKHHSTVPNREDRTVRIVSSKSNRRVIVLEGSRREEDE